MGYYADYKKKKDKTEQKEQAEQKEQSQNSYYKQWRTARYGSQAAWDMHSKLQNWANEHDAFLSDYSSRFGDRSGDNPSTEFVSDAQQWYEKTVARRNTLDHMAEEILADLQMNRRIYGDDYVNTVSEMLTSGREMYTGVTDFAKSDVDFWSQFTPTEEQITAGYDTAEKVYNAWREDNKYRVKHEDKNRDEINRAILYAEDEAEADWLRQRATELWTSEDEQAKYDRHEKELHELYVEGNEDFYYTPQETKRAHYLQEEKGKSHERIEALKNRERYSTIPQSKDFSVYSSTVPTEQPKKYDLFDETEAGIYNYLHNKEGKAAADAFYEVMKSELNRRKQMDRAQYWADYSAEHPYLADAVSVGTRIVGGVGYVDALGQRVINDLSGDYYEPVDFNSWGMTPSIVSSTIRGKRSEKWAADTAGILDFFGVKNENGVIQYDEENPVLSRIFKGRSAGDIYQGLMSMVDSRAASLTGAKVGPILLAASSGTQTMLDVANNGGTEEQALTMGLLSGLAEWFFEKYEIEGLLKKDSNVVRSAINQAITEGFGEGATSIANLMADSIVMGRNAELSKAAEEYQKKHPEWTVEKCLQEAWIDKSIGIAWDTIGGAVTGGVQGGASSVGQNAANKIGQWAQHENDAADSLEGITNAVSNPLKSYPSEKRNVIRSFINATDQKLKSFAQSVKAGDKTFRREKISDLTDRAASDIGELLNIDVSGYTNNINTNGMQHIINRHGENGSHDSTMANDNDIARVGWVLENYDSVEIVEDDGKQTFSAEFRDSNNNPAPQIRFIKKIDGTYYVVEAACENKYKKLWVQSAYLQKNEDVTQVPTADQKVSHERHAQGELASPSSLTSISDSQAGVNGENVDPLTQLARETVEARYAAEDGVGVDGIDSAEGRAIYQDQAVDVVDIDKAGGGKVTVKLADGRSVDATALEYEDSGEAELWRVIGKYAEDADSARALLQEYRNGDLDAYKYARGIEEAFLFGKLNLSPKEMELQGSFVNLLDPAQRNMAYKQGKIAGENKARQKNAEVSQHDPKHRRKGAVHYGYEGKAVDESKLNGAQKVGVAFAKRLARKKGMTFYFYRSFVQDGVRVFKNPKGEIVTANKNGWYDPSDGSIHIDLNSGDMGSTVLFTIAHELTHWMKDTAPMQYRELCGIITEGFLERGQSIKRLVENKMEEYRKAGEELTWEKAYDEVIASSLEGVLSDGRVMDLLDAAEAKSKPLWEQLKSFLEDIAILIRDTIQAYRNVEPESPEGRMVLRMKNLQTQIQDVFAAGLHEGGENFREGGKINTAPEGGVKYSYIGNTKDGRRCYQSGFDDSVSMDERIKLFKKRIATIFNLGAVELKTDVKKIKILGDKFTSQKNLFGDLKPKDGEYTAKINSLYDLADILATSKYDPNATSKEPSYVNPGVKPKNAAHKNVKYWYKFRNEIVFDGIPYTVTFNIRDKGTAQYQYLIEFKENKTPGISNTAVKKPPANTPSVLQGQYTQSGSKSQQNSIRYQKNEAAQTHMAEQNASMAEDMEGLNELVAVNKKHGRSAQIRESSIEASATFLMKTAGAKGEKTDLVKLLADFYKYVATSTEQTWESIRERAMPVVCWLMRNTVRTKQRSDYAQDILNTLHNSRVSLDETQKGEVAHIYGSFGAFRNTVMGSITLVNDGISLDSQWQEWAEMYPDVFDKDMNAADMPEALSDIIRRMRNDNTSELEYESNRELIEQELLRRVYDSYWNASTLYSVADHYEGKIKQLKTKHRQRMQMVYARHQAAEAQQRNAFQQRQEAARAHYEEQYQRRETEYKESRRKAVERHEKAQVRQKIKRTVRDLWKLQERAPKDRRTKEELREFVDSAIKTVDMVWLKNYNEYDMVRNGVNVTMSREQKAVFARCQELLKELDRIREERKTAPAPDNFRERWNPEADLRRDDREEALKKELAKNMKILRDGDVFKVENELMEDSNAGQLINDLIKSYEKLKSTKSPYLKNAYNEKLPQMLADIKEKIGAKPVRNMTLQELEKLYDAYSAVLHVVRSANQTFADEKAGTLFAKGTGVVKELKSFATKVMGRKFMEALRKTGWDNLTPAYVFRRIGSATLERLYTNLLKGQNVVGRDIAEAKAYYQEQAQKYGAHNWDMDKRFDFEDSTGKKFSLSLGQMMSVYALSRRQQAIPHLEVGGIMLDTSENYVKNLVDKVLPKVITGASTYKLDSAIREGICSKLSNEQRAFVEATQRYLSNEMAEKGNSVSMVLYGIRLFKEKNYFPLRVAKQGVYVSTELIDQSKLKNSGFTKEVTPGADNAVVISDYSKVWTEHVKQMSDYHGMALPMEDMDRVLNFGKTPALDEKGEIKVDTEGNPIEEALEDSVCTTMQNIYGAHPENYIREMMRQLNGGVRTDPAETVPSKMMRNFKKAQVAGSLSVWIQQWTSIFRAMAHIDFWHFIHTPKMGKARDELVAEMKKHCGIAIIKEMGGYSTGMGSSFHDYITMAEPKGVKENWKEFWKHPGKRIDEATGWLPARADENTWMRIWLAVKKETHKIHPELKGGTDVFFEAAADRFTEVINLTQVYDSTLSKSSLMRSSGTLAKMITQFAGEPTMVLNMAVDAMLQHKRTGKVQWQTMFAMTASVLINAMCSSLIYAMRDDDEEETFAEKYMESLAGNLIDGFNPLTYMPIIRDIWSIFQGYDVGRSDMALVTDFANSAKKLVAIYQKEDVTEKQIADAWWGLSDGLFNITGLPVRNIRREYNAIRNLFVTLEQDAKVRDTTMQSISDVIQGSNRSSVPILAWLKGETKAEKLLDAIVAGDMHYADRIRGTYKTEDAANSAVAREVKERFEKSELDEETTIRYLQEFAGQDEEDAEKKVTYWEFLKAHPESDLDQSPALKFLKFAEPAGISLDIYTRYVEATADLESDKDEDGKTIANSKRNKVWAEIHKLPISKRQKDALHYAAGYKESSLEDAPWH